MDIGFFLPIEQAIAYFFSPYKIAEHVSLECSESGLLFPLTIVPKDLILLVWEVFEKGGRLRQKDTIVMSPDF